MGFKKTSELLNIGLSVTESAANTYTSQEVQLPLSSLDREVFVVTDIIVDANIPDLVAGTNTTVSVQVTRTEETAMRSINNPTSLGRCDERFFNPIPGELAYVPSSTPGQVRSASGSPQDYIGIIATPNAYIAVQGSGNATAKFGAARITGYRAKADADTYAALVTEEINL